MVSEDRYLRERRKAFRENELAQDGWKKQATYDEPRLSEVVEMYRELGFEVHLEPFEPRFETGCTDCMQATPDKFETVYTRPKARLLLAYMMRPTLLYKFE